MIRISVKLKFPRTRVDAITTTTSEKCIKGKLKERLNHMTHLCVCHYAFYDHILRIKGLSLEYNVTQRKLDRES